MRENANKRRKHQPCITEISPHHAPPASTEERGSAASGEAWRFGRICFSYLLTEREEEKKWVSSLLFLTQKDAEECLKFRQGWRVWNLSPRGQTDGFFSFQALIDLPLSSLATQKDTWKNFWWGCDVRSRVTCSAGALSWFLTSTSARLCQRSLDTSTFPSSCMRWRGFQNTLCSFLCISARHASLHFREERW